MLIQIENDADFAAQLDKAHAQKSGPGLVVVDFFATWCGPCKIIAPVFSELSESYPSVQFLKVDGDNNENLAVQYGVRSFPTFLFFRGRNLVDRLIGADANKLRSKIQQLATTPDAAAAAEGTSQGSSQNSKEPDLMRFLERSQCECLNEDDAHPLSGLLSADASEQSYLLSDTDAQLVIFITFSQFVKIRALEINGPEDSGPKRIKLFVNQTGTPDFSACESAKPVQSFDLEPTDLQNGNLIQLNYVKFQKITTLTIFIADNQKNTDVTRIDKLRLYGSPVSTTNMQNFKRVAGQAGEGHA